METTECPNCGSLMNVNDPCPECDHVDGDTFCDCDHCHAAEDHEWEEEICRRCGEEYVFCVCRPIVCCVCFKSQNACRCDG